MRTMLYVQTDRNVKITKPEVALGDIAKLSCRDPAILARMKALRVKTLSREQYGRHPMSASDLLRCIQKDCNEVEVTHIGAADFILTFEAPGQKKQAAAVLKILFVCLATFFGMAFSIMTFNADVDIRGIFDKLYQEVTGVADPGFTILELSYSIGIGIGVIFFFNHFGRRRITQDPTPMEVEMRTYEDSVDTTIIEQKRREGTGS